MIELNKIYNENCLTGLKKIHDNSIDCCVTSPPYFGLRDYGNDDQIGLESSPEEFINSLVCVFQEVKRALKPEGTLWLNLGDSYANKTGTIGDIKHKDLIGIPWMAAFALRSCGWYLRQDIIWHKPNPMPESVTDRCTKSHEYVFLLSKNQKYYYNYEVIMQESTSKDNSKRNRDITKLNNTPGRTKMKGLTTNHYEKSNKRSVWTVSTKPLKESHFATFPEKLIVDMVKAGCPEGGVVLDPFMGAGTTAVVSKKLNRNYIGFELNKDYINIAENRILNEIGLFND